MPPFMRAAGWLLCVIESQGLDFQSGLHPASASLHVLQQRHALASASLRRVFGFVGAVCVPRSTGMRGFLVQAAQVQGAALDLCENVAQPCPEPASW